MTSSERHRGKHPQDQELFALDQRPTLIQAAKEMAWLMERDYSFDAVLKLVGDRYSLRDRQRMAVGRAVAPAKVVQNRLARQITQPMRGCFAIDTFNTLLTLEFHLSNSVILHCHDGTFRDMASVHGTYRTVLLTLESHLSNSVILHCHDGTFRDMASVHGTYRTVEETKPAIEILVQFLAQVYQADTIRWLIDEPVSNSGRLKQKIAEVMEALSPSIKQMSIDVVPDPDYVLKRTSDIVVTSDSVILDHCQLWVNLLGDLFEQPSFRQDRNGWLIDFGSPLIA